MGKKTRTQSALKSSNILYLKDNNSKFGAEELSNNLPESKSENSTEVDQCIFLGALRLKPVPDIFQVSLQPISLRQQSSNILYNNNNKTQFRNKEKNNSLRKNRRKSSTKFNKDFFIGNVSDHKFENKILKLIGQVKQSIKEEIADKSEVNSELDNKSDVKSRKYFEYCIEAGGTLTKRKLEVHKNLSTNPTKIESNNKFPEKKLSKKVSLKTILPDNKTLSDSTIKMTSKRMKTYENFTEGLNKLNTNVQNNSLDKDIAVENVIRRLRQKRSIEVKKVQDVDSKLKRISQMPETKPKPEQFDQSKSFIINVDSYDTPKSSETVDELKVESQEVTEYLELEDDDIEDYLEIDQNVVEDLEALIPEEEIVSISNSLIQPENGDLSIESVKDTEKKPENTDISISSLPEPILVICDSNNTEEPKLEAPPIAEIKDEEVENNTKEQSKEVEILNVPEEPEKILKSNNETVTINNNGPLSKNYETELLINPIGVKPVETLKRKSEEIIPDPKKKKISPKTNKTQPKKKELRKSNKSRQDSNASKNLRKITDFFTPDCVKTENTEDQNLQIKEKESEEISLTANDKTTGIDSPERIESKMKEHLYQARTLRSRSVLPKIKISSDPKINDLSTNVNEVLEKVNNSPERIESEIKELLYRARTLRSSSVLPKMKISSDPKINDLSTNVNEVLEKVNNDQTIKVSTLTSNKTKNKEIQPSQEIETVDININNSVENGIENDNSSSKICTKEISVVEKIVPPIEIIDDNDEIQPKIETTVNTESINELTELSKTPVKENNRKRQPKGGNKRNTRKSKVSKQLDNVNDAQEKKEEKSPEVVHIVEEVVPNEAEKKEIFSTETEKSSRDSHVLSGSSTDKEEVIEVETAESSTENMQVDVIEIKDTIPEIATKSANILSENKTDETETSTQVKQTQKRDVSIKRRKTGTKITEQSIIETNETKNSEEKIIENETKQNEEVKGNQGKKEKKKPQKRSRTNNVVQDDTNEAKIEQKSQATKLEIYDFDDKSNESVEVLEKSVKRRKQTPNKNNVSPEKQSNDQDSPTSCKKQNENNNRPNITPGSIESYFHSLVSKPANNSPSDKDVTVPKDETASVDLNNAASSENVPKESPEAEKEVDQFGQEWKPTYGPYKRIDRCNVCLLSFKSYKKLRAHKKIHEVENLYKCWECDDCFEDVEKLAAHLRIHKGKMPYPCKKCDATFWTSFQLERHQLVHVLKKVPPPSKPPSKVFKCEECGKEFKKICDLERHTRVHTGEKPSVCNICNKRFQQSYNLNKHLYTHTQEKNFECVICQKKFGRNDVLNRHVLTHSIVKPFRCSICSRTFIRNSQLKLHLRKHHGLEEDPGNETSVDDPVAGTSAKA